MFLMLPIALSVLLLNFAPANPFYNGSCHRMATSCTDIASCQVFMAVHCESVRCLGNSTQVTCQIVGCDGNVLDDYTERCDGYSSWGYCLEWMGSACSMIGLTLML